MGNDMVSFGPTSIIAIRELQGRAERAAEAIRTWPPVRITLDAQFVLGKVVDDETWEVRWPANAADPAYALSHVDLVSSNRSRVSDLNRLWHCQEVSPEMFSGAIRYCQKIAESLDKIRAEMAPELAELKAELDYLRLTGLVPAEPDVNELLYPVAHALIAARDSSYSPEGVRKIVSDLLERRTTAISTLTISRSPDYIYVVINAGQVNVHLTVDGRYREGQVYAYLTVPENKAITAEIDEYDIKEIARKLARLVHTPGEALLMKRVAREVYSYREE